MAGYRNSTALILSLRPLNYTLPQLHLDLQPYLEQDELSHPLLTIDGGVYPALYQRVNQVYQYKQRMVSNPAPPNEWQSYLPHLAITERQIEFIKHEFGREDPEYFKIIGQIWTDFEILGCTSSWLELLLNLEPLRQPDRKLSSNVIHMMTGSEQEKLARLPDRFTVYRGHDDRLLHGMSWTIDRDIALQYAIGRPGDRSISTGTAIKTSVIALIDRWSESEIIVPSNFVRDIYTQSVTRS
jgi:hypothetical protein